MVLVAVCDNSMFMYADKALDKLDIYDKCIVYNKDLEQFAPKICMGSWTDRTGPWEPPTPEQIEEAKQWELELPKD